MDKSPHSPQANRYTQIILPDNAADGDYALVRNAIEYLSENWREQPSLAQLSQHLELGETATQKLFKRWAGLSPKQFSQAVTLDYAKKLLLEEDLPLLDASFELGLSSPSRLHDLFVSHEAMAPGIWKAKGAGLKIAYGFHACPFGQALIMVSNNALVGLAFCDHGEEKIALEDMQQRWPNAYYFQNAQITEPMVARVFEPSHWQEDVPLKITLIGTDFEICVWQALLKVPLGRAASYSDLATQIGKPKAVRALGAAVGKNPISFVVPCHRALGKSGNLTGYHWGLTRKRAMLGWEAGITSS